MQILGVILLIASSWYLWKLTSNFLDEPTKENLLKSLTNMKSKINKSKSFFSKENMKKAWDKYKEEGETFTNKDW